jgi:ribose 5-phosphate isomerase A
VRHDESTMTSPQDALKRAAAAAALRFVEPHSIIGIGTGSTVNFFIEALAASGLPLRGGVASSEGSAARLRAAGIAVLDLNELDGIGLYIDGADEATRTRVLVKGGGGALTREKIVAAAAARFVCIVDESKLVTRLGRFPVPVEVIPMARALVARALRARGGRPLWRESFVTDNGNQILDVHDLEIEDAGRIEREFDALTGVVCTGICAARPADLLLVARPGGVEEI